MGHVNTNITRLLNELCESYHANLFNKSVVLGLRDHATINKRVVFVSTHIVEYQ